MNSKIKKILLTLPFFAFSDAKNKTELTNNLLESCSASNFAFSGSAYASYLVVNSGAFSVGPVAGISYDSNKILAALIGLQAKMTVDLGYVSGVRFMAAALLGLKPKTAKTLETKSGEKFDDEYIKKINESSNSFFKGVFVFLGADTPYYFSAGLYVRWSESSRFTKSSSVGLAIVPNMEVVESVEIGAIAALGYNYGCDYKKLTKEQAAYVNKNMMIDLARNNAEYKKSLPEELLKEINSVEYESFMGVFKFDKKEFSDLIKKFEKVSSQSNTTTTSASEDKKTSKNDDADSSETSSN